MAGDCVSGEIGIVLAKDRGHNHIDESGTEYPDGSHETNVIADGDQLSGYAEVRGGV